MADKEGSVGVGFDEEGMSWLLPMHVSEDSCHSKEYLRNNNNQLQLVRRLRNLPAAEPPVLPQPKASLKPHHRARSNTTNWAAAGGSGMQAIFLDSSQRSCGTGVFLPRGARSTNAFQTNKKPACSPVLLPSRVVQVLNLNVQELGLQIKPPPQAANIDGSKSAKGKAVNNKKKAGKDASTAQCCFMPQSRTATTPEIFLPKEWTY